MKYWQPDCKTSTECRQVIQVIITSKFQVKLKVSTVAWVSIFAIFREKSFKITVTHFETLLVTRRSKSQTISRLIAAWAASLCDWWRSLSWWKNVTWATSRENKDLRLCVAFKGDSDELWLSTKKLWERLCDGRAPKNTHWLKTFVTVKLPTFSFRTGWIPLLISQWVGSEPRPLNESLRAFHRRGGCWNWTSVMGFGL